MEAILDRRTNKKTGLEEYLVQRGEGVCWETRDDLVLDGSGPQYAERGAQYGLHGEGSTRDRLNTFRNRQFALKRVGAHHKNKNARPTVHV